MAEATTNTSNTTTLDAEKDTELKTPYNPTDPIVVFDPTLAKSNIVIGWEPAEGESGNNTTGKDYLKSDAIRYPLIKVNNHVLDKKAIIDFDLSISGFLPKLSLEIHDEKKSIQGSDVPGVNNIITVVITAPVDGANKKISMDFYIKTCDFNNGTITYEAEYKLLELNKSKYTQIGSNPLTTWQFLGLVAKECKLGFAATDKCQNISDARWRQIYSQTYKDYIIDQIKFGGVDEYSVFDAWVDEFGYLVMVNLPYLFTEKLDPKQLVTKLISGETMDENNVGKQDVHEVCRLITNDENMNGIHNLRFTKYESIVDNDEVKGDGTLNSLYYMTDPCSNNTIQLKQIQIIEDSVDGIQGSQEYEYEKCKFAGVEFSDTPIVIQKQIVNAYFRKYMSQQLYVEMPKVNASLQRGMLVNVDCKEYNMANKKMITENYGNALTTTASGIDDTQEADKQGAQTDLQDESKGIPNPALSGLYYIHKVGFKYEENTAEITQYMYLVRRGIRNNLVNRYTGQKINTD